MNTTNHTSSAQSYSCQNGLAKTIARPSLARGLALAMTVGAFSLVSLPSRMGAAQRLPFPNNQWVRYEGEFSGVVAGLGNSGTRPVTTPSVPAIVFVHDNNRDIVACPPPGLWGTRGSFCVDTSQDYWYQSTPLGAGRWRLNYQRKNPNRTLRMDDAWLSVFANSVSDKFYPGAEGPLNMSPQDFNPGTTFHVTRNNYGVTIDAFYSSASSYTFRGTIRAR